MFYWWIGLPNGSSIDLIRVANEHFPNCDVMVITIFDHECHILQCIEAGATGYLLKDCKTIDIPTQIHALRQGASN